MLSAFQNKALRKKMCTWERKRNMERKKII